MTAGLLDTHGSDGHKSSHRIWERQTNRSAAGVIQSQRIFREVVYFEDQKIMKRQDKERQVTKPQISSSL
jgi:hypothetical protein